MRRWIAGSTFLAMLVAAAGCVDPLPPMRPAALPSIPTSELAVVELSAGSASLDSISTGPRQLYLQRRDNPHYRQTSIELSPGTYTITYHALCGSMEPRGDTITLPLEAGHRYKAGLECCYWWSERFGCSYLWSFFGSSYATFLWFEDLTTGKVLAGSRTVPATNVVEPEPPHSE